MDKRILYVGLSAPHDKKKLGSMLIRWVEFPKTLWPGTWFRLWFASHTFIVFPAHRFRPFYLVNEAAGTAVRWMSQPHFQDHAAILKLYKFTFDVLEYKALKLYGELHSGAPYSFKENLGIAWVRLVQLFTGRTVRNPFGVGEGAQKCSELVMRNVILRFLRSYDIDLDALSLLIYAKEGYHLTLDVDTIGVRDIHIVLEYMADEGLIERVPVTDAMRVEEPFIIEAA